MQTTTFVEPALAQALFYDSRRFDGTEVKLGPNNIGDRAQTYMVTDEALEVARKIIEVEEGIEVTFETPGKITVYVFTRIDPDIYAKIYEIVLAFAMSKGSLDTPSSSALKVGPGFGQPAPVGAPDPVFELGDTVPPDVDLSQPPPT